MKTVKIREKQVERFKNVNLTGVSICITTITKLGWTTSDLVCNLENIQVKGVLKRDNQDKVLFNETLKNLIYLSEWDTPIFELIRGYSLPVAKGLVVLPGVAGAEYMTALKFDFGGIINIDGSDELSVEVTVGAGTFKTNVDENTSFVEFDVIEGVGRETYTPYIKSYVIEANQSNPNISIGDNVMELLIANYDKDDFRVPVINNVNIDSDKWSRNDSYNELIVKNSAQFTDNAQFASRAQSFRVYSGYELDGVKVNLNLNTAQVAASQNYLLWYCFETNDKLVTKAAKMYKKHAAYNNAKGQFNPKYL